MSWASASVNRLVAGSLPVTNLFLGRWRVLAPQALRRSRSLQNQAPKNTAEPAENSGERRDASIQSGRSRERLLFAGACIATSGIWVYRNEKLFRALRGGRAAWIQRKDELQMLKDRLLSFPYARKRSVELFKEIAIDASKDPEMVSQLAALFSAAIDHPSVKEQVLETLRKSLLEEKEAEKMAEIFVSRLGTNSSVQSSLGTALWQAVKLQMPWWMVNNGDV